MIMLLNSRKIGIHMTTFKSCISEPLPTLSSLISIVPAQEIASRNLATSNLNGQWDQTRMTNHSLQNHEDSTVSAKTYLKTQNKNATSSLLWETAIQMALSLIASKLLSKKTNSWPIGPNFTKISRRPLMSANGTSRPRKLAVTLWLWLELHTL